MAFLIIYILESVTSTHIIRDIFFMLPITWDLITQIESYIYIKLTCTFKLYALIYC